MMRFAFDLFSRDDDGGPKDFVARVMVRDVPDAVVREGKLYIPSEGPRNGGIYVEAKVLDLDALEPPAPIGKFIDHEV